MSKQYDSAWPFPQRDEHGNRLPPPPAPRQPKRNPVDDIEDALL